MSVASDGRWRCESRGQVRGGGGGMAARPSCFSSSSSSSLGEARNMFLERNSARVEGVSQNPKSYQKKSFLEKIQKNGGDGGVGGV